MKHKTILFALLGILKPRFKRYIIHLKYECDTYTNHRYEYKYKRNYRKLQKMKESIKGKNIDTMENIL